VVAATAFAVAIFLLLLTNSSDSTVTGVMETTKPAVLSAESNATSRIDDESRVRLVQQSEDSCPDDPVAELTSDFVSAKDAAEAFRVIDQAYIAGNERLARELTRNLHARCGYLEGFTPPFERTRWAYEKLIDYCRSYEPPEGSEHWIGELSPSGFNARRQMLEEFSTLPFQEFETKFAQRVSNAQSIDEIRGAKDVVKYLVRAGAPLSLGVVRDSNITSDQLKEIQTAGITLYGCRRFGGCGPDDYDTLEICVLTGLCEQGWSTFDYYSRALSPIEFSQAMDVLAYLIDSEEP
jgi:hypothetical protein